MMLPQTTALDGLESVRQELTTLETRASALAKVNEKHRKEIQALSGSGCVALSKLFSGDMGALWTLAKAIALFLLRISCDLIQFGLAVLGTVVDKALAAIPFIATLQMNPICLPLNDQNGLLSKFKTPTGKSMTSSKNMGNMIGNVNTNRDDMNIKGGRTREHCLHVNCER